MAKTKQLLILVLIAGLTFCGPLYVNIASAQVVEEDSLILVDFYNATEGPNWKVRTVGQWLVGPVHTWRGISVEGGRVTTLRLHGDNVRGSIPPFISKLTELRELEFPANELTGEIPPEIGLLVHLESLHLYDNHLTGSLPDELANLSNLTYFDVFRNDLTGPIPDWIYDFSKLYALGLSFNNFHGTISPKLATLDSLEILDIAGIPISGVIPQDIGKLVKLRWLRMGHTGIEGEIPESIGNLINLEALFLDDTQLTGSLPEGIGNLSKLDRFEIDGTPVTGAIPMSFIKLSMLNTFRYDRTGLCAPTDSAFQEWLASIWRLSTTNCTINLALVESGAFPNRTALKENFPNPFNFSTTIDYSLDIPAKVRLEVFDLLGKRVRLLDSGFKTSGEHEVTFDATGLPSGIYFYTLSKGDFSQTRKMVVVK